MTAPVSGASAPLPYDLHPWAPVRFTDTAAALTMLLSASGAGAGVAARRGTAPALTAPLTASAAAGRPARLGAGVACTLPLAAATGTGEAITAFFAGDGAAILLPFNPVNGNGVKRVSMQAVVQVLPLVDMPASGLAGKADDGESCTLLLQLSDIQAAKGGIGAAAPAELRISAGQGDGTRYEWTFYTPTDYERQPFSQVFPAVLTYTVPYSSTVWQDANGEWHTVRGPNPASLSGALRIYEGGRLHTLSPDDLAVLTAAGFGDNLVLQEMH